MENRDWVDSNAFGLESFVCHETRGLGVCHARTRPEPGRSGSNGIMDPKEGGHNPGLGRPGLPEEQEKAKSSGRSTDKGPRLGHGAKRDLQLNLPDAAGPGPFPSWWAGLSGNEIRRWECCECRHIFLRFRVGVRAEGAGRTWESVRDQWLQRGWEAAYSQQEARSIARTAANGEATPRKQSAQTIESGCPGAGVTAGKTPFEHTLSA
jgi:hypothetical protein